MTAFAVRLIAWAFVATPAYAGQLFDVTGVDQSDVVNIRVGIDTVERLQDSAIIGTIPPNGRGIEATGISLTFNGQRWRKIRFKGTTGWVNAKFLAAAGPLLMPANLSCIGTEPFWRLDIHGQSAEFTRPENHVPTTVVVTSKHAGLNRSNLWSYGLNGPGSQSKLTGILVFSDLCSDGMSDFTYAFELYLLGLTPDGGPVQGCCYFGD